MATTRLLISLLIFSSYPVNAYHDRYPWFCEDGGWDYRDSCFHLINTSKTWQEAEEYCVKEHQGHLASILDAGYDQFVYFTFWQVVRSAWIGIKMNNKVFQQKWSSGWFVAYENWRDAPLQCSAFNGKWENTDCSKKLPFICQVSSGNFSPPLMPPGPKSGHCPKYPAGWRDLGGEKCYFIEKKGFIPWQEANLRCVAMGGVLASIHSQNESDVLQYFTTKRGLYIGLHRSALKKEQFEWSDGSPMDFTNWEDKEPNYSGDCVYAGYDFQWKDVKCTEVPVEGRGYICSVKKIVEEDCIEEKISGINGFSLVALLGAMFCMLCAGILIGLLLFYYRPCDRRQAPEVKANEIQYEKMELNC